MFLKDRQVSSFGCFVFDFWMLRVRDLGAPLSSFECFVFESWVVRFRVLGASFSSFGCFVFEIWVLRASVFIFECFVFETTYYQLGTGLLDPLLNRCLDKYHHYNIFLKV